MNFEKGTIVRVRSGGPPMTVSDTDNGGIECVWFDQNGRNLAVFDPLTIEASEQTPNEKDEWSVAKWR